MRNVAGVLPIEHHRIGLAGQEAGYLVDVPLVFTSSMPVDGTGSKLQRMVRARTLMASAFESGILEEKQGGDNPGVSAVRLLQLSNAAGYKTFLANSSNWATVEPLLDYANPGDIPAVEDYINAGFDVIIPEHTDVSLNEWGGIGFIAHYSTEASLAMGMIIQGDYSGGYSSFMDQFVVKDADFIDTDIRDSDTSWDAVHSDDPVNMATGAFEFNLSDIRIGGPAPMGLNFRRYYSSGTNYSSGPLGWGWDHTYNMYVSEMSNAGMGLGERTAIDAASAMVNAYVLFDLMDSPVDLLRWVTGTVTAKWGMDQLIDNAVSAKVESRTFMFNKLADGSWYAPPTVSMRLGKTGSNYYLTDITGVRFTFNSDGTVATWSNANNVTMTFAYTGGRLTSVVDEFGRSLTFTYSGDLITEITDNSGRSVSYDYLNGNLTEFEDAETHSWFYGYDAENRMVTQTRPLGNTVVMNTYDGLGRVECQADAYSVVFNTFYFSGMRNVLEDHEGNQTVYHYDSSGRLSSMTDAAGNSTYKTYNGLGQLMSHTDTMERSRPILMMP